MTPQPQPGEYVESAQLFATIGNRAREAIRQELDRLEKIPG